MRRLSVIYVFISSVMGGDFSECSVRQMESVMGIVAGGEGDTGCKVRPTMVQVPFESDDWQLVGPTEVEINRCGGSCPTNVYHHCVPATSKSIQVPVVLSRRSLAPGPLETACATLSVEEHESCQCGCRTTEDDCGPGQQFLPYECRCSCTDHQARGECIARGMYWDRNTCSCMCPPMNPPMICPQGYLFDYATSCTCIQLGYMATTDLIVVLCVCLFVFFSVLLSVGQCYRKKLGPFKIPAVTRVSTAASELMDLDLEQEKKILFDEENRTISAHRSIIKQKLKPAINPRDRISSLQSDSISDDQRTDLMSSSVKLEEKLNSNLDKEEVIYFLSDQR